MQPQVSITTQLGEFVISLNKAKSPITVENFLAYCKSGFYLGTTFHRIIPGFAVQGGGFDLALREKANLLPRIGNESFNGLTNKKGTIAMARTQLPHSATSQFYINLEDNSFLDGCEPDKWGYTVFGEVIQGWQVIEGLAKSKTQMLNGFADLPEKLISITDIKVH